MSDIRDGAAVMTAITDSLLLLGRCPPQRHFKVNAHVLSASSHTAGLIYSDLQYSFPDRYCINNETVLCEMKVLCGCVGFREKWKYARYLIERWPEGFLILFIVMYKKNKYMEAQWYFHWYCHCLSPTWNIILIFKYLIKRFIKGRGSSTTTYMCSYKFSVHS